MTFCQEKLTPYKTTNYEINPTNWLTKLAWKILLHYKCAKSHWADSITYQQVLIDIDKVTIQLLAEVMDQIQNTGMKPKYIYIGREKFYELAGTKEFFIYQSVKLPLQLYGAEVIVIPWMKGLLVV